MNVVRQRWPLYLLVVHIYQRIETDWTLVSLLQISVVNVQRDFFGTSAAAPVAAGALALILETNPDLTYRDVMHIIAETARIPTLIETEGWIINGGGYHVNDRFGFGVLDAGLMVSKAQQWINVQPRYDYQQVYQGRSV